jgi:hypothetical protein
MNPGSVNRGKRMKNGWKNSGSLWIYNDQSRADMAYRAARGDVLFEINLPKKGKSLHRLRNDQSCASVDGPG